MKSLLRAIFLAFTLGLAVGVYLMRQQQRHECAVEEARRHAENEALWNEFTTEQKAEFHLWQNEFEKRMEGGDYA